MKRFQTIVVWGAILAVVLAGCATSKLTRQQREALADILVILDQTIEETHEILENDPDPTNQYVDILERLNGMKEIIEAVRAGDTAYDDRRISHYIRKIKAIEANIQNAVDEVFSNDVFFGLGEYRISDLSPAGKRSLETFTESIIDSQVKVFQKLFPDYPLVIEIRAVGYADETPLLPDLAETLVRKTQAPIPDDPIERKHLLNKTLSYLRAEEIYEHIRRKLASMLEMGAISIGRPEIVGMGEALPYPPGHVDPPYRSQDERRRICKLYSRISLSGPDVE